MLFEISTICQLDTYKAFKYWTNVQSGLENQTRKTERRPNSESYESRNSNALFQNGCHFCSVFELPLDYRTIRTFGTFRIGRSFENRTICRSNVNGPSEVRTRSVFEPPLYSDPTVFKL